MPFDIEIIEEDPLSKTEGELPFSLFDERIPVSLIPQLIKSWQGRPLERFNILNPRIEFERYYQSSLNTTHDLIGIERPEFLELPYDKRLRHIKCFRVVHHVLGTTAAIILDREFIYSFDSIYSFFRYCVYQIFTRYAGRPDFTLDYWNINKTFIDYLLIHIVDKNKLNTNNQHLGKWIDLFVNQNNVQFATSDDIEMQRLDSIIAITLEQEYPEIGSDYLMTVVTQTVIWHLVSGIEPSKLHRFKYLSKITLDELIQSFSETLNERQLPLMYEES